MDKYLEAGYVALMVKHPITGEATETLVPTSGYTQNQPGVAKFASDMKAGTISEAHEGADISKLALVIFSELATAKGEQYVLDALARTDKSVAKAAKAAKLATWRELLDSDDMSDDMSQAADLFASIEAAKATLAALEADVATAKADVAAKLGIDPTFDLALVSTGWYIAEDTKATGKRTKVTRDYSADHYESDAGKTINEVEVSSSADVTSRDDEGQPTGWKVVYTAKGKSYTAEGSKFHKTHMIARKACMAVIAPENETAVNTPKWFGVPRAS